MRVNAVWIGENLTTVERLCLASWVHWGIDVQLWVYGKPSNVPEGVEIADGSMFLPGYIYRYRDPKHHRSPVLHANVFRYRWLAFMDEPFIDCDTLCLGNYSNFEDQIISSEGSSHPNFAFVNRIPGKMSGWMYDEAMRRLRCCSHHWGGFGPALLKQAVELFGFSRYVAEPNAFCPIHWSTWQQIIDADDIPDLSGSLCCHLWGQTMRKNQFDPDRKYPDGCLWEQWKKEYLPCP